MLVLVLFVMETLYCIGLLLRLLTLAAFSFY
jgi:hypothetical protein